MKKILFGLIILFVGTQVMTSCSSESNVLSQFSKRKYMKRFKSKDIKQKDAINDKDLEIEYAKVEQFKKEEKTYAVVGTQPEQLAAVDQTEEMNTVLPTFELSEEKKAELEMFKASVNKYSEPYVTPIDQLSTNKLMVNNYETTNEAMTSQVNEVVLAILCIFIPPLAVYLYEDSITTNFWVDLIATLLFWLPGIILAFLIVFAGVSF